MKKQVFFLGDFTTQIAVLIVEDSIVKTSNIYDTTKITLDTMLQIINYENPNEVSFYGQNGLFKEIENHIKDKGDIKITWV